MDIKRELTELKKGFQEVNEKVYSIAEEISKQFQKDDVVIGAEEVVICGNAYESSINKLITRLEGEK